MEYIAHRVNTVEELKKLPAEYGVELDLRDGCEGRIYISHNPFVQGEDFEQYLGGYHHGTMILNVKSERIELTILDLLVKYHIENYFFLDSSFPMIYLLSCMREHKIALRYSEYEGMDTIRNMQGRVDWVWVDCFTRYPITRESYRELKDMGYKLCLVSPELQGRAEDIESDAQYMKKEGIIPDAVCTKAYNIDRWRKSGFGGKYAE